ARQFWSHGVCRSSWCLLFVLSLFGARVPQPVARQPVLRVATHALGEQTPLSLSSPAILTRHPRTTTYEIETARKRVNQDAGFFRLHLCHSELCARIYSHAFG